MDLEILGFRDVLKWKANFFFQIEEKLEQLMISSLVNWIPFNAKNSFINTKRLNLEFPSKYEKYLN